jgi:hypothetical protein
MLSIRIERDDMRKNMFMGVGKGGSQSNSLALITLMMKQSDWLAGQQCRDIRIRAAIIHDQN